MKNNVSIFLFVLIFSITSSCQTGNKTINLFQQKKELINARTVDIKEVDFEPDFTILNAEIIGDVLKIDVSFTGEKGDHDFDLFWNGSIMKSLPPKAMLHLVHKKTSDKGKKEVVMNLEFDISMFKRKEYGDTIILLLEGFEQQFRYSIK